MSLFRSFFSVSAMTLLGRISGYFRELLMAHWLGISEVTDALLLSLKLPSFFRRIFSEGALHTSLVPSYKMSSERKKFSGMVFASLVLIMGLIVLFILMHFDSLINWMCHQSNKKMSPSTIQLFATFGPIVFPSIFFLTLSSFFGSIANAHYSFSTFAFSHALVSILTILFMVFFSLFSKNYGLIFAWSVLLASFSQAVFMAIECSVKGFFPTLYMPRLTPDMRRFISRFFLGFLSFSPLHIGAVVTFWLATKMPKGSISLLNYADRIIQLPTTLIGLSLGSVLLPSIAEKVKNQDCLSANTILEKAVYFASILIFPVAVFVGSFSFPIVSILFGYSKITPCQMQKISIAVNIYSCALPAFVLNRVLVTRFFAQGNMWQPFFANITAVTVEALLSAFFIEKLAHNAIPLGVSMGMWVNILMLFMFTKKNYQWNVIQNLGSYATSIFVASGILFFFFKQITYWTSFALDITKVGSIGKMAYLLIMSLLGGGLFLGILMAFKQTSIQKILSFFKTEDTHQ
jgi:putative peptidoglycan lipid II flippase